MAVDCLVELYAIVYAVHEGLIRVQQVEVFGEMIRGTKERESYQWDLGSILISFGT